jgi:hypothetical protein
MVENLNGNHAYRIAQPLAVVLHEILDRKTLPDALQSWDQSANHIASNPGNADVYKVL